MPACLSKTYRCQRAVAEPDCSRLRVEASGTVALIVEFQVALPSSSVRVCGASLPISTQEFLQAGLSPQKPGLYRISKFANWLTRKTNQRRPHVILISNPARDSVPNCSLSSGKVITIESGSFCSMFSSMHPRPEHPGCLEQLGLNIFGSQFGFAGRWAAFSCDPVYSGVISRLATILAEQVCFKRLPCPI